MEGRKARIPFAERPRKKKLREEQLFSHKRCASWFGYGVSGVLRTSGKVMQSCTRMKRSSTGRMPVSKTC